MMKCDDIVFADLLDADDDTETHDPEVAHHLEHCTVCQTHLAHLAADDEQWDAAQHWLATSETSSVEYVESIEARERWKRPLAWTDTMAESLLAEASHPEMLGRIGRYDVERLIGSGGMGVVFKAYDTELNRPVAVKLLAPYLAGSGAARNRFAREARAAAAVVDDHVVPIHNVETDDEHPFLVMKYIAGGSLQQRLDREGSLEVCEVLRIGTQVAKGLAAAHSQGLIHRDVKPSNVLLDEGVERALLTDFGLARATDDASLTRSGFHPGTPHYMSPEQVRGEAIDGRSDLFGLGCVLYAMCTGHPPFRSETSYAVLRRITDDTPRGIRESNPDIPAWLESIVMKLLAKTPDQRFDSAEQVGELLEGCLAHAQQPTVSPLPTSVAALSSGGREFPPSFKFIAAAAFAFLIFVAGVFVTIELNKGTLTIESNADDVPIRILQDGETVQRLTVKQSGETVRIAAGNYVVVIDTPTDELTIEGSQVVLRRGESEIVRVVHTATQSEQAITNAKDVAFVLGDSSFEPGDNIEIESITSSGEGFEIGATVTVKGQYTLKTNEHAHLGFYSTVALKPGETPVGTPIQHSQMMDAKKGTHPFTLSKRITAIGSLHITFYHPETGQGMGGVYFAEETTKEANNSAAINQSSENGTIDRLRKDGSWRRRVTDDDLEEAKMFMATIEKLAHEGKYRKILDYVDEEEVQRYAGLALISRAQAKNLLRMNPHLPPEMLSEDGEMGTEFEIIAKTDPMIKSDPTPESVQANRLLEAITMVHMGQQIGTLKEDPTQFFAQVRGIPSYSNLLRTASGVLKDPRDFIVAIQGIQRDLADAESVTAPSNWQIERTDSAIEATNKGATQDPTLFPKYELGLTRRGNWMIAKLIADEDLLNLMMQFTGGDPSMQIEDAPVDTTRSDELDPKKDSAEKVGRRELPVTDISREWSQQNQKLLGSWHVMTMTDEKGSDVVPHENIVLTFDSWTFSWLTEPDDVSRYIYRPMAENAISFVNNDDSIAEMPEGSIAYSFEDGNHLHIKISSSDPSGQRGWSFDLERIVGDEQPSAFASRTIAVDVGETYGWSEDSVVDMHGMLVRSPVLLGTIRWPNDIAILPNDVAERLVWLSRNLEVETTEGNEFVFGIHGHITTKEQRERIVRLVAEAYHSKISRADTPDGKQEIERLIREHSDTCAKREKAEAAYRAIIEAKAVDARRQSESHRKLKEINDSLTDLQEQLLGYGVPRIAGSLDLSIERAKRGIPANEEPNAGKTILVPAIPTAK